MATEMQEDKTRTAVGSDRADAFLFAAGDGLRLRAVEATLEKLMHGHARGLATMCSQLAARRDHFVAEQARCLHAGEPTSELTSRMTNLEQAAALWHDKLLETHAEETEQLRSQLELKIGREALAAATSMRAKQICDTLGPHLARVSSEVDQLAAELVLRMGSLAGKVVRLGERMVTLEGADRSAVTGLQRVAEQHSTQLAGLVASLAEQRRYTQEAQDKLEDNRRGVSRLFPDHLLKPPFEAVCLGKLS